MTRPNLPLQIVSWIAYVFSCLFLGLVILAGRSAVITASMLLTRNAYLPRFLDKAYLVIFGIVWLISWVYMEGYFSQGLQKGRLWPYILRAFGIELILLFMALILTMLVTTSGVNWAGAGLVTFALVAGLGMLAFANRRLRSSAPAQTAIHSGRELDD